MATHSKFKPLSAPVYTPVRQSERQIAASKAASAFLASHGFSAIDGAPVEPRKSSRKVRPARVCKDTSALTRNI